MHKPITALLLAIATPATLFAAAPAQADAAASFREGNWAAVVKEGRAEATAASLILAGRAQLWQAGYETRDKARAMALIMAAEKDFDAALAKAPSNPEAQVQKAVAIGYRAKLTKSAGLGKDARDRFVAVRTAHPEMALAWAAVAGWHGGAIAALGSFMGGAVLGAKAGEVETGFVKALRLDPQNPSHRTYYAMTLLDMNKKNAAKAAAALEGVGQMPARDAFEARLRAQGQQLSVALRTGDATAAQALARKLAAFSTLG
ncbi:MAG: hypothetical protein B7Z13_14755 [Caulobacterales bacterium 32-67-6]|nr:MAG: hypothetical protein B7Z13_14755 [Caulobacterales bacterium 32-67-6]